MVIVRYLSKTQIQEALSPLPPESTFQAQTGMSGAKMTPWWQVGELCRVREELSRTVPLPSNGRGPG